MSHEQGSRRTERVGELIVRELSSILLTDAHDPRVVGVTLISCHMAPDLKVAKIFYSLIGGAKQINNAQKALNHMANFLQKRIANALKLRYTPELRFEFDDSLARGQMLLSKMAEIAEREGKSDDDDDESGGAEE